ncbi:hypothetical protein Csa_007354 [Cucumis sativus]|uniref:Uncharacterized protein n=1 Tax=Cucumis sativus TaxID=3659 RepID=A0A0A0M0N3_CUCSA|nr:hypothetical protein Csa_007354 [Cucumis sativus]
MARGEEACGREEPPRTRQGARQGRKGARREGFVRLASMRPRAMHFKGLRPRKEVRQDV